MYANNLLLFNLDWLRAQDMWMDNPILNIDSEAIEGTVADMNKIMVRSIKIFADIPAVQNVALEIKHRIDNFKPKISLLLSLRNPGMKQRHWDTFQNETGKILFVDNISIIYIYICNS